jgi:hypothetical protein
MTGEDAYLQYSFALSDVLDSYKTTSLSTTLTQLHLLSCT